MAAFNNAGNFAPATFGNAFNNQPQNNQLCPTLGNNNGGTSFFPNNNHQNHQPQQQPHQPQQFHQQQQFLHQQQFHHQQQFQPHQQQQQQQQQHHQNNTFSPATFKNNLTSNSNSYHHYTTSNNFNSSNNNHHYTTSPRSKRGTKRTLTSGNENKVTTNSEQLKSNNNNSTHRKKVTPTKSLINMMKRQRFSRINAGQIRLESDVKECRRLITTGIVEVYHERQDMDTVNILIRRVFPQPDGSTPYRVVQFVAHAPKRYPHKPLKLCLREIPDFSLSNTFTVSNDRNRTVTFPMINNEWNPVYSLYDVVIHLTCLVYDNNSDNNNNNNQGEMDVDQVGMNIPYVASVFQERFNKIVNSVPHVIQKTTEGNEEDNSTDETMGDGGGGGGGGSSYGFSSGNGNNGNNNNTSGGSGSNNGGFGGNTGW